MYPALLESSVACALGSHETPVLKIHVNTRLVTACRPGYTSFSPLNSLREVLHLARLGLGLGNTCLQIYCWWNSLFALWKYNMLYAHESFSQLLTGL
jgi:hypothetical protein